MTLYVSIKFGIELEYIREPFSIFTLIGDSIVAKRMGCIVSILGRVTTIDLVELEMICFDFIMGIDWL